MTQTNFHRIGFAILIISVLLPIQSWAQDDVNSYKVGERVEYKENSYPEVWKEGTVIKVYPEYKQVVVRWDPNANYPHGYEQAYGIGEVRHVKARAAEKPAPDKGGNKNAPVNRNNNGAKDKTEKAEATGAPNGTGLMTKQEIIGYMRSHGYANGQPKHDPQVCKDLVEQIKRRGVQERLEPGKDDLSPFADNGCYNERATDVVEATKSNLGTPITLDWLSGTWVMYVVGGTVDYAPGNGYIYRKNESLAKLGFLTINSDGAYTWKVNPSDPPAKYVRGRWRKATPEEMGLQGGAGIVLQKAAEGADWIVFKYMDPFNKADRVEVEHIQYRGSYRRIGWRR